MMDFLPWWVQSAGETLNFTALLMLGVLSLAELIIVGLRRKVSAAAYQDLCQRTHSWWVMVLTFLFGLYMGKTGILLFFGVLSFFALREYLSRVPTRRVDRRVLSLLFLAVPVQYVLIANGWVIGFHSFIPLFSLGGVAVALLFVGEPKGFLTAMATLQLGLMCTIYSLSHLAYLPLIVPPKHNGIDVAPLLFFVAITQTNDVFQYISGKLFGKRKVMPTISPKKTIEGLLGGMVLSSLLAVGIGFWLTPFAIWQSLLIGAILSLGGFFGDVLMSAIKRDVGIKDFSQLIPGHGGILDRVDSFIITGPLFLHFLRLVVL